MTANVISVNSTCLVFILVLVFVPLYFIITVSLKTFLQFFLERLFDLKLSFVHRSGSDVFPFLTGLYVFNWAVSQKKLSCTCISDIP